MADQLLLRMGLFAVSLAISFSAYGQEYSREDGDLVAVSKAIAAAVRADPAWRRCTDCQKCGVVGKAIDLARSGAKDTSFVTAENACACGAGLCPIWIVRGGKILLSDGGNSLVVGRTSRNGLPEVVTDSSTSTQQEIRRFEFDGTKYNQVPMTAVQK